MMVKKEESFCQMAGNDWWCIYLAWSDNRRGRIVWLNVNEKSKQNRMVAV